MTAKVRAKTTQIPPFPSPASPPLFASHPTVCMKHLTDSAVSYGMTNETGNGFRCHRSEVICP